MSLTIVSEIGITSRSLGLTVSIDGFDDHPPQYPQTALNRAATLVRATMLFRQQFKQGKVKPESTKDGPLCMDTWR